MTLGELMTLGAVSLLGAAIALGYAQSVVDETSPDEALSAHIVGYMCIMSTDVEDEREACQMLCELTMRNDTMLAECEQGVDVRIAMDYAVDSAGVPE